MISWDSLTWIAAAAEAVDSWDPKNSDSRTWIVGAEVVAVALLSNAAFEGMIDCGLGPRNERR